MSEIHIELKDWHVLGMIATMAAAVFKDQIQGCFVAVVYLFESRRTKGSTVEILNDSSGEWERVVIREYVAPIPFVRAGGIRLRHGAAGDGGHDEKMSFANFRAMRSRVPAG